MVVTKSEREAMEKEQLEYVLQEVMDEEKDSTLPKHSHIISARDSLI